ncbi:MAG: ComF family protein [Ignavibacteriales bacterium]|nr:ComF family protein [Ignavibacteriales bacterium]
MNLAPQFTHRVADSLLEFIYPPLCISCDRHLEDGSQKVCSLCWNSIERLTEDHPLYLDTKQKLLEAGFLKDVVSTFVFQKEGAFQHIAHFLKYRGYESLGLELGKRLGGVMEEWNIGVDVLVPIPLHKVKLRERGYNQAEMIARGISVVTGIPVGTNIVYRMRHTQTQTKLNLEERKQNMEDAFGVSAQFSSMIEGKTFLIVDDVITTGATINSCAEVLLKNGASKVIAACAALAQKDVAGQ